MWPHLKPWTSWWMPALFNTKKVNEDLQPLVDQLITQNLAIEHLSFKLKMHIIFAHLIPWVEQLGGDGLGLYRERAGEREYLFKFWISTTSRISTTQNTSTTYT